MRSEYNDKISKISFSEFSINSSLRKICYDTFISAELKRANGKIIANLLSAEYEGILNTKLVDSIKLVFTFLKDPRDRIDFLISINTLSKADQNNREVAVGCLVSYLKRAEGFEPKQNLEIIRNLLHLVDSDHPLVVAKAFTCLDCITSKRKGISFVKEASSLFTVNSKNKTREAELLDELIPVLALKNALDTVQLQYSLKIFENMLKNKDTTIEAQKKRVEFLSQGLTPEELTTNLKIINILETYCKLDQDVLALLDSTHIRSFIEIITNLENSESSGSALNIFKTINKYADNQRLSDFFTKVLTEIKTQSKIDLVIVAIKTNIELGVPIELALISPILAIQIDSIKDAFYQEFENENKFIDFLHSLSTFAIRSYQNSNQNYYAILEGSIKKIHEIIISETSYNREILSKLL